MIWGLSPIFWKLLVHVPAGQLLAHRILWAGLILAVLLAVQKRISDISTALTSIRIVLTLLLTTILISANWLVYIWAVVTERIVQASLGYYINPLVTILLGMLFLRERLSRTQFASVGFAAIGVGILVWSQGELPWIALVLATSFGFYGLLRKRVRAEAEIGLAMETGLLLPLVLAYLAGGEVSGNGAFGNVGIRTDLLLVASGLVTAMPLLLFTYGARLLPLSTVGVLQFSAPTLQFILAVFVYREPFTRFDLVSFLLIWTALVFFSWEIHARWPQRQRPDS